MLVSCILSLFYSTSFLYLFAEYKEAFALFDKRGTGAVPREILGDLLRALGQNPTQAEVSEIVASAPRDGMYYIYYIKGEVFFIIVLGDRKSVV